MKLAEFDALCVREWKKQARGGRGDVCALTLTEASYDELTEDVIAQPQQVGHRLHIRIESATAGPCPCAFCMTRSSLPPVSQMVNPVTRALVDVHTKPGGKRETARVKVWGGTFRQAWWPATA